MRSLSQELADLARAFPRQKIDSDTFRLYLQDLADLPEEVVCAAVRHIRRTSEWFPTVAAIRQEAAERMLALPSEADALTQIEARVQWGREQRGDAPFVHPLVKEAVDHVGGFYSMRSAEEPTVIRGQFLRLYRELRSRQLLAVQSDARALDAA